MDEERPPEAGILDIPIPEEEKPQVQERGHRHESVGVDDEGRQLIPLNQVLGGKTKPTPVETTGGKHILRQTAPPPRGWYKDKVTKKGTRPRPCYSEALLTTPYSGYCNVGCAFCLTGNTRVNTPNGLIEANQLRVGDNIFSHEGIATVTAIRTHLVNSYYNLLTRGGRRLSLTGEHPVFVPKEGWVRTDRLRDHDELQVLLLSDSETMENYLRQSHLPKKGKTRRPESGQELSQYQGEAETAGVCREIAGSNDRSDGTWRESCQGEAEIGCLETSVHGAHATGRHGAEIFQASSLSKTGRQNVPVSFNLGISHRALDERTRLGLAFRNEILSSPDRGLVPPRFPHLSRRGVGENSGGQKLGSRGAAELDRIDLGESRDPLRDLGCEEVEISEDSVQRIERINASTTVYDIETSSGTFYAESVLVHNCYVNMGTRGNKATLLPTVNAEYPEQMDMQLSKMWVVGAAYMSSYTEVFQKLEGEYHITQRLTEVFVKHGIPIFYLSRKVPPDWVEDALLQNPYSYMQWSINTSNPEDFRRLSPGAFKIDDLLYAIERFNGAGIYTSFQVNPVLPGITTLDELLALVEMLAGAGGRHVIVKFAEESPPNRRILIERLQKAKLDGVDDFENDFTQLVGHQYYVRQDLRLAWLKEVLALTRRLGITMSLCYEYYDDGQGGASLAPWFNTSDQCHGPAVPVHYRPREGAPFEALPGCYRKGCLYCADHGTQACQNETLLEAKALQYKDFREVKLGQHSQEDWNLPDSAPPPERASERGRNPGLQTDAELWGYPTVEEIIEQAGR